MDKAPLSTLAATLDPERKKLLYRAWHRGMKEMDILFGNYANQHLQSMNETDLAEFEKLIEVPDQYLFRWVCGTDPIPENYQSALFQDIIEQFERAKQS